MRKLDQGIAIFMLTWGSNCRRFTSVTMRRVSIYVPRFACLNHVVFVDLTSEEVATGSLGASAVVETASNWISTTACRIIPSLSLWSMCTVRRFMLRREQTFISGRIFGRKQMSREETYRRCTGSRAAQRLLNNWPVGIARE